MSRYFSKITMAEFKEKIQPLLEDEDDGFPYNLPDQVSKDIGKVNFDFENFEYERNGFMNYPCGFETLSNGMPCLFVNAGGDWETPVCFVIYFDGKKLRGYVPTKGNMWNRKAKAAFGSDEDDEEYISYNDPDREKKYAKRYKEKCEAILAEAKEWMDISEYEEAMQDPGVDYGALFGRIDVTNAEAIYKDVMERIVEK